MKNKFKTNSGAALKLSEFVQNIEETIKPRESNNSKLELVLDILKKINSSLVLSEVLELVLNNAINITKSERGFIVLKSENGNLEYMLCLDAEGKTLPQELFKLSTTVVNDVYETGQSKFIESALNGSSDPSESIINLKLQTIMCAPLMTKNEKFGVIYVDSQILNKIDNKEVVEMFEILASQAGIVINNAMMHQRQVTANFKLKKAYQELEITRQEAEKLEKLKNHFLSQMSHEIRTPFNIILGSTQLLKSNNFPLESAEIDEIFRMLEQGSNRIIRTLDEIMEMSKIISGNYEIHQEKINLEGEVLKPIISNYEVIARGKGLYFIYEKSVEINEVLCDKFMIYQIIQELIDNAVKFTQKGTIRVKQFLNREGKYCISVRDTGVGISKEYLQYLFEPFTQEDTGHTRKFEGNGLALALVKKYAEMNNLSIDLKSEKGVGTEVFVVFN
ncbi:MAG: hypothetical protein A2499_00355 [Stygiobacter sp. RIFOXYC12_FULL_38_8]|nr:MAG: hypothetical protein A2279_09800 [Stygiobacter sp. RIFOXYA12_FULL_38_9]OGV06534.1 MAG: hypothetical protein A2299_02410 [Stygiobacter sp. RIFOXYB2_FULL_37_11]OGV13205.1 MAG: hypothetical protein A2440_12810 [Stygiobacter sp. RIFOXYC2_FULL_38_25]OGV14653.1 MAG: hypothetical protein A2237_03470 [Stygiobacter sp. RIFOXYA2_FULL_38_8]OGV26436.1 MAG: hypothetical protein A2499_00355 [Stygiobacter sp. RIFOXYC12_FULL_38_8]OGV83251.1 MAG: hypothetical protein A2X65_16365 [Stygiobacter sp. GWF2_